jgi:hypothetical protein
MCLTEQQKASIHELKMMMELDKHLGEDLSEIDPDALTPDEGKELSEELLNPVIYDIVREFCPGRT